jgi:predicted nuclease of predicted toxin-antitoxin system
MRIKLDENLPESLLASLAALGHDVDNVRLEGMVGSADADVWQAAQIHSRLLITQDLDFSDIRKFAPGSHHGLLLIRMHLPGRLALANRLRSLFETEAVESWARCFVLVTDRKVRLHRPRE